MQATMAIMALGFGCIISIIGSVIIAVFCTRPATLLISLLLKLPFPSFHRTCGLLKKIPGQQGHWLYGNLLQRADKNYHKQTSNWVHKNNHRVTKEWLGPVLPCVNIHHPHLIMNQINTSRDYRLYQASAPWIGTSSAFSTGQARLDKHKLIKETLHIDIVKSFTQLYTECTSITIAKWEDRNTKMVCVYDDVSKLVLDILLRCLYSFQSDCQNNLSSFVQAIEYVQQVTNDSLSNVNGSSTSCFTMQGRRFRTNCNLIHQMTNKMIKERKSSLQGNSDLLDTLLFHNTKCKLSDKDISNEMNSFLFWGLHTTTMGLTWTMYCLAKYPDMQDQCRAEVLKAIGERHLVLDDDIYDMKYTSWFVKETLRHHSPLVEFFRIVSADTMIGEYLVPKHTTLCFKVESIHFNPDCWKDPETFNPLRFSPSEESDIHPYGYLPFSLSRRQCLGEDFAMRIMLVVVALILRKFTIQLTEENDETDGVKNIMLSMQPI